MMDVARDLSFDALRMFLLSRNGRASQGDLADHFKDFLINRDDEVKKQSRQKFKEILNIMTVVKDENGVKFICLMEQYRSNVAYRNANLQNRLEVNLGKKNDQIITARTRSRSRTSSNRSHSENESSESPESPCHDKRKVSSEHRMRRLSAIAGLKSVFQIRTKSCESLTSNESEHFCASDEEIRPEDTKWMAASCNGDLDKLKILLKDFPNLLEHKDFIHGYTTLHWAAKRGRSDIIDFIVANQTNKEYINTPSHGGYTPLHVASLCGKNEVITKLIDLGADIHARDYHGKKPKDIVKNTVKLSVQRKLGRPLVIDTNTVLNTGVSITPTKNSYSTKGHRSSLVMTNGSERRPGRSPDRLRKRSKSAERIGTSKIP